MLTSYLTHLYRGANAFRAIAGVPPLNDMHIANAVNLIRTISPQFRSEYPFSVRSVNFHLSAVLNVVLLYLKLKHFDS